ncbi:hypothetical protein [Microbacter margulisiae]|uniref:Uncharacterized protein n=1 Tax=Microbacter margulisiae TaxID=1350067 RepID=A0A7W5H2H9_9PORP|nr:hypothetical protein [Microbacter margulisiae]MBB3187442.1 hypothetical protein [Microbacter margulisiae]
MAKAYVIKTDKEKIETYFVIYFPYPYDSNDTIAVIYNDKNQKVGFYIELNNVIENTVKNFLKSKGRITKEINNKLEDDIKSILQKLHNLK